LQGSGYDLGGLGKKLAPLADEKFREYVEMFISDEDVKRRIFS